MALLRKMTCNSRYIISQTSDVLPFAYHFTFSRGWRRAVGRLIFIGHFPQKSLIISGSFAKNAHQLAVIFENFWLEGQKTLDTSSSCLAYAWMSHFPHICEWVTSRVHVNESCPAYQRALTFENFWLQGKETRRATYTQLRFRIHVMRHVPHIPERWVSRMSDLRKKKHEVIHATLFPIVRESQNSDVLSVLVIFRKRAL